MPSIIDTLDQEVMWYAQDGLPVPLQTMEPGHMVNLFKYLLRNAERLYEHKLWAEMKRLKGDEAAFAQLQLPQDPEQWIQTTPFFRALKRRIMNYGSINPDSLTLEGASVGQRREEDRKEDRGGALQDRQVFYLGAGQSGS